MPAAFEKIIAKKEKAKNTNGRNDCFITPLVPFAERRIYKNEELSSINTTIEDLNLEKPIGENNQDKFEAENKCNLINNNIKSNKSNTTFLEMSQLFLNHPISNENDIFKTRYIKILEYFVKKYSAEDMRSNAILKLYKEKLLSDKSNYTFDEFELKKNAAKITKSKFKPFYFYTYRYCLIIDILFIIAYDNRTMGEKIFSELLQLNAKRHRNECIKLFDYFYEDSKTFSEISKANKMASNWELNRNYIKQEPLKIIVTATMSAGKSTLLNALVGKKVNKTQNDACTAKIHYILNKPYEDGLCYEYDHRLNFDADYHTLMEDDENNKSTEIIVGTFFRTTLNDKKRIWYIDTPGVNYSQDINHKKITEQIIENEETDLMVYVMNGENIGTEDDRKHLQFVLEHYGNNVVFVINKMDRFRKNEDSVRDTIDKVILDLKEIGYDNPLVLPISSYAAYLAKMVMYGESLNEDEVDEYERLKRKLNKEEYRFDQYNPAIVDERKIDKNNVDEEAFQLLMHSGLLQLEQIIYNARR